MACSKILCPTEVQGLPLHFAKKFNTFICTSQQPDCLHEPGGRDCTALHPFPDLSFHVSQVNLINESPLVSASRIPPPHWLTDGQLVLSCSIICMFAIEKRPLVPSQLEGLFLWFLPGTSQTLPWSPASTFVTLTSLRTVPIEGALSWQQQHYKFATLLYSPYLHVY